MWKILFSLMLSSPAFVFATERPWAVGETLTYEVGWKAATAGTVVLKVEERKQRQSRLAEKVSALVSSNVLIDAVFRVRDRMESWIDEKTGASSGFSLRLEEGDKRKQLDVFLNPLTGVYKSRLARPHKNPPVQQTEGRIKPGAHDYLSALYFFRNASSKVGQLIPAVVFEGKEEVAVALKITGEEKIVVPSGAYSCLVGEVLIKSESGYSTPPEGRLLIWFSNDKKRIPVQFVADPAFGRLEVKLSSISH